MEEAATVIAAPSRAAHLPLVSTGARLHRGAAAEVATAATTRTVADAMIMKELTAKRKRRLGLWPSPEASWRRATSAGASHENDHRQGQQPRHVRSSSGTVGTCHGRNGLPDESKTLENSS